jgi:hypothetical protein
MVRAGGDRLRCRQRAQPARLQFPKVDPASLQEFKLVRKTLLAEGEGRKRR